MVTVTKTSDDDGYQTFSFPASLSGTVYIRVRDSNRVAGNREMNTVHIDHLFIRGE